MAKNSFLSLFILSALPSLKRLIMLIQFPFREKKLSSVMLKMTNKVMKAISCSHLFQQKLNFLPLSNKVNRITRYLK